MNLFQEMNLESLEKTIETSERKPVLEDITLIIPTLGRSILAVCLAMIVSGSHWPGTLIVVHQGDEQEIMDWVKQVNETGIRTSYIHSTERGKPASINVALAQTQTRFICMIDDDCFVDADWLHNMHRRMQKNPDWIITGRVNPAGNETVAVVQSKHALVQFRPRLMFDMLSGGNMGTAMDIVRRVGLLDEDPLLRIAAEDVEWGYRALRKGIPIAYAPEVAVSHFGWRDGREKSERFKSYAYGHGGFYGKYLRRGDLFILIRAIAHFMRALRRWIKGKARGDPELAVHGKAYLINLLPGILAGLQSTIRPGVLK